MTTTTATTTSTAVPPTRLEALCTPRLLGAARTPGDLPALDRDQLVRSAHEVRLLGRGGAAFPVATKLAAMPLGSTVHVLVNGSESEPASAKDRTLMRSSPHLVLDGVVVVARALRTNRVTVVVHDAAAAHSLRSAADERTDAACVRVVEQAARFVSGEVRAAIRGLDGGPAVPPGRRVLPHESGIGGAPTFASNVETFAQLAVLARRGPGAFATTGAWEEPGTTLLTLLGDVPAPGVVEVPTGLALSTLLATQNEEPRPVLIGGYHGTWVADVRRLRVLRPALDDAGAPLGAGVVARLSPHTCALGEVAAVASWLAGQSAGQCGPCYFGLPAVADDLHALAQGREPGPALRRRLASVRGRGACAHPDGTWRFVTSALATMGEEIEAHRRGGCGRPLLGQLPTGAGR